MDSAGAAGTRQQAGCGAGVVQAHHEVREREQRPEAPRRCKRPARRLSSPVAGDGEADDRAGDLPEL